jgi:hypothetical protein
MSRVVTLRGSGCRRVVNSSIFALGVILFTIPFGSKSDRILDENTDASHIRCAAAPEFPNEKSTDELRLRVVVRSE